MNRAVAESGDLALTNLRSRLPRIRFKVHRTVRAPDRDTATSRRMTRRKRVGTDLVNVVATGFARCNRRLNLLDRINVNNGVLYYADLHIMSLNNLPADACTTCGSERAVTMPPSMYPEMEFR